MTLGFGKVAGGFRNSTTQFTSTINTNLRAQLHEVDPLQHRPPSHFSKIQQSSPPQLFPSKQPLNNRNPTVKEGARLQHNPPPTSLNLNPAHPNIPHQRSLHYSNGLRRSIGSPTQSGARARANISPEKANNPAPWIENYSCGPIGIPLVYSLFVVLKVLNVGSFHKENATGTRKRIRLVIRIRPYVIFIFQIPILDRRNIIVIVAESFARETADMI